MLMTEKSKHGISDIVTVMFMGTRRVEQGRACERGGGA